MTTQASAASKKDNVYGSETNSRKRRNRKRENYEAKD
jgi:hypothetical protein